MCVRTTRVICVYIYIYIYIHTSIHAFCTRCISALFFDLLFVAAPKLQCATSVHNSGDLTSISPSQSQHHTNSCFFIHKPVRAALLRYQTEDPQAFRIKVCFTDTRKHASFSARTEMQRQIWGWNIQYPSSECFTPIFKFMSSVSFKCRRACVNPKHGQGKQNGWFRKQRKHFLATTLTLGNLSGSPGWRGMTFCSLWKP